MIARASDVDVQGILFDLPHVVDRAAVNIEEAGLTPTESEVSVVEAVPA